LFFEQEKEMTVNNHRVTVTVEKVLALRKLTAMTGTRTTRSQGELLQALNAEEMALAAQMLITKEGQTNGNHGTSSK
jgi:hypothetical protein